MYEHVLTDVAVDLILADEIYLVDQENGTDMPCLSSLLSPTLLDPTDCSTPGLPALPLCCLLKFAQIHVHCVNDAM